MLDRMSVRIYVMIAAVVRCVMIAAAFMAARVFEIGLQAAGP